MLKDKQVFYLTSSPKSLKTRRDKKPGTLWGAWHNF